MARDQVRLKPKTPKPAAKAPAAGVLIRDGKAVRGDSWVMLGDDQPAGDSDAIVSIKRLLAEGEALAKRPAGRLGVVIGSSEAVEEVAAYLPMLSLAAVDFPAYRDGRGFTTARLLRERYHFQGPIRAVGDVLQDLIFFMLRCGIDEFVLKAKDPEAAYAQAARAFTKVYQPAADSAPPVSALRRQRPERTA